MISFLRKYKIPIFSGLFLLFSCKTKTDILVIFTFFVYCWNNVWFVDPDHPRSNASHQKRLEDMREFSKLLKKQKSREKYIRDGKMEDYDESGS